MADTIEDEEDFSLFPGAASRLSSLFPTQRTDENDINQTLTYVPPKQPKKTDTQQQSAKGLKCFHAVAAYTYKLQGGEYTTQGKLGVAIVGNTESNIFRLLLYKGKQQTITTCTIQYSFKFAVEQNNYAKFPDDKGEQWSITFSSEVELINFAKQVAIAKVNSCGPNLSTLIVQDLVAGDGIGAETGDSLEISFTGYLFKNFGFGDVFDNSANDGRRMVIELGKSSIIECWNEGLIGASKGLRRLIIVPPSLGYSVGNLPNSVTPNDVLIFEVLVHKVRRSREHSRSPSFAKGHVEKKPEVPPRTSSVSYDDSIRSRGASLSEQLTQSPRKDNAQIISRMAKIGGTHLLGQAPIAPVQTSGELSDFEKEIEEQPRSRKQSGASPKHMVAPVQKIVEHDESDFSQPQPQPRQSVSSPSVTIQTGATIPYIASQVSSETVQYMNQPFVHPQYHPALIPPVMPSLMENQLPLLVSEARTQNTEVRLSLSKIGDKIDSAIQKIDDIRLNQGNFRTQGQVPYMESVVLAQNIERIVKENIQLKQDVETKNSKIQELNEKICDILQRNQRFFEESNSFLEQRTDTMLSSSTHFQSQIQSLEQEKVKLSSELEDSLSRTKNLESQVDDLQNQVVDMHEKLKASEEKYKELKKKLESSVYNKNEEYNSVVKSLERAVESSQQQNEELISQLSQVKERFSVAEKTIEQLETKTAELRRSLELRGNESSAKDEEISELKNDLQKALFFKKKYETLHENARLLKNKYELQLSELLAELKVAKAKSVSSPPNSDFASEIKRAMNVLYKSLQTEFASDQSYSGNDVREKSLNVIRKTTLAILGRGQRVGSSSSKESVGSEKDNDVKSAVSSSMSGGDQPILSKEEANEVSSESTPSSSGESPLLKTEVNNESEPLSNSLPESELAVPSTDVPNSITDPQIVDPVAEADVQDPISKILNSEEQNDVSDVAASIKGEITTLLDHVEDASEPEKSPIIRPKSPETWRPQPSPPPLFDEDEEDEDDWLK